MAHAKLRSEVQNDDLDSVVDEAIRVAGGDMRALGRPLLATLAAT